MGQEHDENKNLPPEYNHLGEQVKATNERVQQIDQQIENLPPSSQPKPIYTPTGMIKSRFFDREKAEAALTQEKTELKNSTFRQIEQAVRTADQKTARQVKDELREELFPNPFFQMSAAERNAARDASKDVEESQNLMDTSFTTNQPKLIKDSAELEKTAPKKEFTSISMRFSLPLEDAKIPEKVDKKFSMSSRFSQGLSYTRDEENIDKRPEKSREPEPDKE